MRDGVLEHWDRWLFVGQSHAVLLHDLLGQHDAAWVLMGWYETFGTVVVCGVFLLGTLVATVYLGWPAARGRPPSAGEADARGRRHAGRRNLTFS